MTASESGTGSVTLIPLFWRRRGAWFWLTVLIGTLAAEIHDAAPAWALALLTAGAVWVLDPLAIRLIITPERITYRQRRLVPRAVTLSHAPRGEITSIHVRSHEVVFANASDQPVLRVPPGWTAHQYRELTWLLGVPLYDHRVKYAWQQPRPRSRRIDRPGQG